MEGGRGREQHGQKEGWSSKCKHHTIVHVHEAASEGTPYASASLRKVYWGVGRGGWGGRGHPRRWTHPGSQRSLPQAVQQGGGGQQGKVDQGASLLGASTTDGLGAVGVARVHQKCNKDTQGVEGLFLKLHDRGGQRGRWFEKMKRECGHLTNTASCGPVQLCMSMLKG